MFYLPRLTPIIWHKYYCLALRDQEQITLVVMHEHVCKTGLSTCFKKKLLSKMSNFAFYILPNYWWFCQRIPNTAKCALIGIFWVEHRNTGTAGKTGTERKMVSYGMVIAVSMKLFISDDKCVCICLPWRKIKCTICVYNETIWIVVICQFIW